MKVIFKSGNIKYLHEITDGGLFVISGTTDVYIKVGNNDLPTHVSDWFKCVLLTTGELRELPCTMCVTPVDGEVVVSWEE